mgnify:CR=1 FL=1
MEYLLWGLGALVVALLRYIILIGVGTYLHKRIKSAQYALAADKFNTPSVFWITYKLMKVDLLVAFGVGVLIIILLNL